MRLQRCLSVGMIAAVVVAGGTGDFYKKRLCYANGTGNYLKVTDYDKAGGQEYHWKSFTAVGLKRAVYIDGVKQVGTEGFKYYGWKNTTHRFYGTWISSIGGKSDCTINAF